MRLPTFFIFSLTLLLTIHSGKTNYEEGIPTPTLYYFMDRDHTIRIVYTNGNSSCVKLKEASKDGTTAAIINVNNDCNSQTKILKYIGKNIESSGGAHEKMEGKILKSVKNDCIKEFSKVSTIPSSAESTNTRWGCGTSNSTEASDNSASGVSHGKRSLSFVNNSSTTEYTTCSGKNKPHYAGICLLMALLIHSYYKSRPSGGS